MDGARKVPHSLTFKRVCLHNGILSRRCQLAGVITQKPSKITFLVTLSLEHDILCLLVFVSVFFITFLAV